MFQLLFYPHRAKLRKIRHEFNAKIDAFEFSTQELRDELVRMHSKCETIIQQARIEYKRMVDGYHDWPPYFI